MTAKTALKMGKYKLLVDPAKLSPTLTHIIFVCDSGFWGKGANLDEAIKASNVVRGGATRSSNVQIYMCTENSRINENGTLVCKTGDLPPVRIN